MAANNTSFQKGVSGNPGGKQSASFREMREMARKHCPEAIQFYIDTLKDAREPWERREKAAGAILDRGIGKAVQSVVTEDGDGNTLPIEVKAWLGIQS